MERKELLERLEKGHEGMSEQEQRDFIESIQRLAVEDATDVDGYFSQHPQELDYLMENAKLFLPAIVSVVSARNPQVEAAHKEVTELTGIAVKVGFYYGRKYGREVEHDQKA